MIPDFIHGEGGQGLEDQTRLVECTEEWKQDTLAMVKAIEAEVKKMRESADYLGGLAQRCREALDSGDYPSVFRVIGELDRILKKLGR